MVGRGAHHLKALCVVAAKLAERYTVPEEVRRRRRSTKPRAGRPISKSPRDMAARGASRAGSRRPSPPPILDRSNGTVSPLTNRIRPVDTLAGRCAPDGDGVLIPTR